MTDTTSPLAEVPDTAPPDFHPRRPRVTLPPHACDCHAHICGPGARYPYYAKRIYTPADARLTKLVRRIRPFGWHVEFLLHVDEFPGLDRLLGDWIPDDALRKRVPVDNPARLYGFD